MIDENQVFAYISYVRKQCGGPKKKWTRGPTESINNSSEKLTKHGLSQYCSLCGLSGHNKKDYNKRGQGSQPSHTSALSQPVVTSETVSRKKMRKTCSTS